MSHKRLSSSPSSSWPGLFTLLLAALLRVPTTSAHSPLQDRQGNQLQGAEVLPPCALQCVYNAISQHPHFRMCHGQLDCLCGENPQPYRELLWSCIDDQRHCRPEAHKETEAAVVSVCSGVSDVSSSSSSNTTSPTSAAPASPSKTGTSQSTTPLSAKEESKKTSKLSTAAIVGISVGAVALLGLIVVACFLLTIMRNRRKSREQIRSIAFEQASPRSPGEGWEAHGMDHSGWASINPVDPNSSAGHYYNSKSQLTPIVTDIPTEKRGVPAINISPVSPVSPSGNSAAAPPTKTKVVASRKIIENHHLQSDMPPSFSFTPATPATHWSTEEAVSPVSPMFDFNNARLARSSSNSVSSVSPSQGFLPGQAFTTDSRSVRSTSPSVEGSNRHTCSAATMPRIPRENSPEPSTPPPRYAPATPSPSGNTDSGRSSRNLSGAAAAGGGMARTDSIAWRRELEVAAERAMARVVRSEQSIQEEGPGERRRKSSIPGLDRFARRASRDTRGDDDSSLASNGETGSSFWNRKGGRVSTPPRSPGFFNPGRRRDSGATGSKRSSADVGNVV
ncbi:hypothetical protein HOY82DRAFT_398244 [Tuber indicum]|nr:hypothetical protein HOY82DRAFT_398244 [Tuber indicum]